MRIVEHSRINLVTYSFVTCISPRAFFPNLGVCQPPQLTNERTTTYVQYKIHGRMDIDLLRYIIRVIYNCKQFMVGEETFASSIPLPILFTNLTFVEWVCFKSVDELERVVWRSTYPRTGFAWWGWKTPNWKCLRWTLTLPIDVLIVVKVSTASFRLE